MSSREVFDTIPPGSFRDDRARPPRVRAVPARATGPAATGTETEAPASVFPGRARAPPPRSTLAARRGSQPHPGRGRPAVARHAMCRAFRSRATARARSARSLARRSARLDRVRVTRGSALRSAREGRRRALRSARAFAARFLVRNRKCSVRSCSEPVSAKISPPLCSACSLGKLRERNVAPLYRRNRLDHTFLCENDAKGQSVTFL